MKQFIFGLLSRFDISHKIQVTALWSMLESFSNPFFTLILIPILTYSLGLETYGVYVIVVAFLSLFSFTSLGMNTTITYYLAKNFQNSDLNYAAEKIGVAILIALLGTMTFSILFALGYFFYMPELNKSYPHLTNYNFIVFTTLILLVTTQIDAVMSAALKGLQVFEVSSKLEFLVRLVGFLVLSVVAITFKNITIIVLCVLLLSMFNLFLRYIKLAKLVNFNLKNIKLNKASSIELINFGKWMTLQNVSGAIFGSLDKIVLGYFTNATLVGVYNILVSVTQLSHYFLANAFTFISPKIAASNANLKILKKKYFQSLVFSGSVTIFILIVSLILFPLIASYFGLISVGKVYVILLVSYGVLAMCVPAYYFALGFGKVKLLSNINTISALMGILAINLLVSKYGMLGAAISRFIYTLFVTITFLIPTLVFSKIK